MSFPAGLAVQTFLMLLLDMLYIPFTKTSLFSLQLLTLVGCSMYLFKTGIYKTVFSFSYRKMGKGINLVWLLFLVGIVYIEYMNFAKCIYFPPVDRDSLAAFETIGYVTAQEQTFKHNILYNSGYNIHVHGPGSYISYTPMVMLSYAYVYVLGAVNSKLINALIYVFFLITIYGCGKRLTTKTGTIMATFFILLTPEMLTFSSLSTTNVIQAVYVGPAVLYSILWFRKRQRKDLYMAAFLMACNLWSRAEGIVFIGAVVCLLATDSIRKKAGKNF
ncbi:MAG: glycosyltransferase family 39 protein [Tannerellaceae bacterium]|nr:glycosyltransferase family 39 protein [Tannerellaceae bacterium]